MLKIKPSAVHDAVIRSLSMAKVCGHELPASYKFDKNIVSEQREKGTHEGADIRLKYKRDLGHKGQKCERKCLLLIHLFP